MDDQGGGRNAIAQDAEKVLRAYLGIGEKVKTTPEKLMDALQKKIDGIKATTAKRDEILQQGSAAIVGCLQSPAFQESLPRLHHLLCELKEKQIRVTCPTLCITFQDLAWGDYYTGGNIKYPDVRGMQAKCCTQDSLVQKMQLFFLLQNDRRNKCGFNPAPLTPIDDTDPELRKCPAILIPSGGKNGEWLGEALAHPENFWWVSCLKFTKVIFLISSEEEKNYVEFRKKGIDVVCYNGFGMGCGRAAGMHVAMNLGRLCIMTDDRTKSLGWTNGNITQEELIELQLSYAQKPFITGVRPKGELNILTLINPGSPCPERVCFSPFFIASKEDKGLHLYCEMLEAFGTHRGHPFQVTGTDYDLIVGFDANNPKYVNTDVQYTGAKGKVLATVTDCPLYKSPTEVPLVWKHLKGNKKFLNQWDAIKMQDSAMFLLLQEIHTALTKGAPTQQDWDAFNNFIRPWFS